MDNTCSASRSLAVINGFGGVYPKNWMHPWKWVETESVTGLSLLLCPLLLSKRTQLSSLSGFVRLQQEEDRLIEIYKMYI